MISNLLAKANQYATQSGRALSSIGLEIVNDGKFFDRIERTGNCNVKTYQKADAWLDRAINGITESPSGVNAGADS